jgi:hypothetical protein
MGMRTYNYDSKLVLSDGAAAYTASGIGQVNSANAILNFGGYPSRTDLGVVGGFARVDAACVVNISAITTATDGNYRLSVMGSNNANGSLPVVLGEIQVGLGSVLPNGSAAGTDVAGTGSTSTAGIREILFSTEQNGINYEYVYLYVTVSGSTSKSITLTAFVAVLPKE